MLRLIAYSYVVEMHVVYGRCCFLLFLDNMVYARDYNIRRCNYHACSYYIGGVVDMGTRLHQDIETPLRTI